MDFIPHPTGGLGPLDIPFVANLQYAYDTDFWSFPKTHGAVQDGNWQVLPRTRLAALAQSWLYFGVMAVFLGRPVDIHHFKFIKQTHLETGKATTTTLVTAKSLPGLLDEWLRTNIAPVFDEDRVWEVRRFEHSPAVRTVLDDFDERYKFLGKVIDTCEELQQLPQALDSDTIPTISLSILVLCSVLRGILQEIRKPSDDDDGDGILAQLFGIAQQEDENWDPENQGWDHKRMKINIEASLKNGTASPVDTLLKKEMENHGWCPFKIKQIISWRDRTTTYYLGRLFTKSSQISHQSCTESKCVSSNVDMNNYVTRHVSPNCACAHVSVPVEEVCRIIAAGDIPVIGVKTVEGQAPILEAKRVTRTTRYIAFSHVWSDGLGNPKANSLPACQIQRLQTYVNQKSSNAAPFASLVFDDVHNRRKTYLNTTVQYFWLDTLCVPVGTEHTILKSRAINQMAAIYNAAYEVIVLDSSIMYMSVQRSTACEHVARFLVSPWMGRCWTFQEGFLASSLNFQFCDDRLDPASIRVGYTPIVADFSKVSRACFAFVLVKQGVLSAFGKARPLSHPKLQNIETAIIATLSRPIMKHLSTSIDNHSISLLGAIYGEFQSTYKEFVRCWNQLSIRTTTKREDIHVILANMLRLNTFTITQLKKPEDRMHAVINHIGSIPLSIFFNKKVPRANPIEVHRNRWLPVYPTGEPLSVKPKLKVAPEGFYLPQHIRQEHKVSIFVADRQDCSQNRFILHHPQKHSTFIIDIHRMESDKFASVEAGLLCFCFLETTDNEDHGPLETGDISYPKVPGAVFRASQFTLHSQGEATPGESLPARLWGSHDGLSLDLSRPSFDTLNHSSARKGGKLQMIYDCPITVTLVDRDVTNVIAGSPLLTVMDLPISWMVQIEQETVYEEVLIQQRPGNQWPSVVIYATNEICDFFSKLLLLVHSGIGIAVLAATYRNLSVLSKASMIIKVIMNLIVPYYAMLTQYSGALSLFHFVLIALFTLGRFPAGQGDGHLTALDEAFIYSGLFIHVVLLSSFSLLIVVLKSRMSAEYKRMFEPTWTKEQMSWELRISRQAVAWFYKRYLTWLDELDESS